MKSRFFLPAAAAVLLVAGISGASFAGSSVKDLPISTMLASDDNECHVPVADWQPSGTLKQKLTEENWTVMKLKVDDGCYEVEGINPEGVRVEAKFDPKTFALLEMEEES